MGLSRGTPLPTAAPRTPRTGGPRAHAGRRRGPSCRRPGDDGAAHHVGRVHGERRAQPGGRTRDRCPAPAVAPRAGTRGERRPGAPRPPCTRLRAEGAHVPRHRDDRHAGSPAGGRMVALADRHLRAHRARAGRPCDDRRLRARRRPPRVPRPRRHPDAQRPGARPVRRRARHDGVVGHRGPAERRRPGRDLPPRGAPLLGRREGRRHASRVERDLRRAPRRGAGGAWRDQPQPRLRRQRPVDRARRRRGGRVGVAGRRRVRERRRPGKPARLSRRVPARHDRRRDRPERRGRSLLQPFALRRPRRAG